MIFSASYDTTVKIITPITFLILLSGIVVPAITGGSAAAISIYYFLIPLIIVITIISVAYAPRYYSIEADEIKIHRMLLKPVKIAISDVSGVEVVNKTQLRGSIRIWGSGAFLGYFGWFISKKIGKAMWYATRMDQAIIIETHNNKRFLISPDNIVLFLDQLPHLIKKRPEPL